VKNPVIHTKLNLSSVTVTILPVKNPPSKSPDKPKLLPVPSVPSKLLVTNNQYPSVLMLPNGKITKVVSSPTVELNLITVYFLLVILLNLGSLKTLGLPHGVKKVISDLPQVTLADLLTKLLAQMHDELLFLYFMLFN